jgi:hypothetical protein
MREAGVSTDVRVAIGPTGASIQAVAAATRADMIIMSTHARTGVHRTMLGSVADGVLHASDRPVLLFRLSAHPSTRIQPLDVYHVFRHQNRGTGPQTIGEPLDHVRHESPPPRWRHLAESPSAESITPVV